MLSSQGATHIGTFLNRKSDYKLYIFTPGPPSIANCEQSAEDFCKKERQFFDAKSEDTFNASNQAVTSVSLYDRVADFA